MAALAAFITPRLAAPPAGLFCSVDLVVAGFVAVRAAPRLGFTTVVLLDAVEMSVIDEWTLD